MPWSSPPPWFDQSNSIWRRCTSGNCSAWPYTSLLSIPPFHFLIFPVAPLPRTLSICVRDQLHARTHAQTQSFLYANIFKSCLLNRYKNSTEYYRNKEWSCSQWQKTSLLAEFARLPGVSLWFGCARGDYPPNIQLTVEISWLMMDKTWLAALETCYSVTEGSQNTGATE